MKNKELIEIKLLADEKVIKETITRIGIANKKRKILYPSCYLYKNFEKYYIIHFKSMFTLTRANGYNNLSNQDIERRNSIIFCLENWGLISVVNSDDIKPHNEYVYVLPHTEKNKWQICHKFNVNNCEVLH